MESCGELWLRVDLMNCGWFEYGGVDVVESESDEL